MVSMASTSSPFKVRPFSFTFLDCLSLPCDLVFDVLWPVLALGPLKLTNQTTIHFLSYSSPNISLLDLSLRDSHATTECHYCVQWLVVSICGVTSLVYSSWLLLIIINGLWTRFSEDNFHLFMHKPCYVSFHQPQSFFFFPSLSLNLSPLSWTHLFTAVHNVFGQRDMQVDSFCLCWSYTVVLRC